MVPAAGQCGLSVLRVSVAQSTLPGGRYPHDARAIKAARGPHILICLAREVHLRLRGRQSQCMSQCCSTHAWLSVPQVQDDPTLFTDEDFLERLEQYVHSPC